MEGTMVQNENDLRMMIQKLNAAEAEIGNAIIGQKDVIRQVLLAMLSGGNVLLEGVPGLGKTQLVKAVAAVCSMEFSRIQFTPDLMPADVTGTNLIVKEDGRNVFQFQKGPVFANLVLADEINRATPKTQSALLEAMQEHTVTVGNETYALAEPFMVLATQNPIENEGTYPLPEAQLDRFLFKIQVDFPSLAELKQIMNITVTNHQVMLRPVLTGADIIAMRSAIRSIPMAEAVEEYALKVVVATHPEVPGASEFVKRYVSCGASPRAAQSLIRAAKAKAFLDGRYNVSFQDVEEAAYGARAVHLARLQQLVGQTQHELADQEYIIDDAELERVKNNYPVMWKNPDAKPKLCFIGCPHMSMQQLIDWTVNVENSLKAAGNAKVLVPTVFTTAPAVKKEFEKTEYAERLKKTGIILSYICPLMYMNNPLAGKMSVITCSNKLRTYTTARFYTEEEILVKITKGGK